MHATPSIQPAPVRGHAVHASLGNRSQAYAPAAACK
eukprot:CAMPEP_0202860774 /NCGR_PEP_ID=MMETSP1391-20130828/2379_1 /ASSEMBLY_ACC=CAM_ASM_000867 /TAXON_ID=1034604 /ORGANISM="Chlamydomonas leiostraca, Strain SAG 11-49" /LENGTH=35 /DNA_ID= /DNA_START= /DNA_END= /DNA_ORIENTATION=